MCTTKAFLTGLLYYFLHILNHFRFLEDSGHPFQISAGLIHEWMANRSWDQLVDLSSDTHSSLPPLQLDRVFEQCKSTDMSVSGRCFRYSQSIHYVACLQISFIWRVVVTLCGCQWCLSCST